MLYVWRLVTSQKSIIMSLVLETFSFREKLSHRSADLFKITPSPSSASNRSLRMTEWSANFIIIKQFSCWLRQSYIKHESRECKALSRAGGWREYLWGCTVYPQTLQPVRKSAIQPVMFIFRLRWAQSFSANKCGWIVLKADKKCTVYIRRAVHRS